MKQDSNVIDLKNHRRNSDKKKSKPSEKIHDAAPVLDMTERRNEMLTQERRKVRRSLLTEFIGAHVVIPNRGLQKVTIFDISEDGIAFDIEVGGGQFKANDEVTMRVYLNQHTYFPFMISVANVRKISEEGVIRHGSRFLKGTVNDVALHHFIKFIETVSASLRTDQGDVMVSGLLR